MKKALTGFLLAIIINPLYGGIQFPQIEGWQVSEETRNYQPDNLFDYINGAAELFLTYNFQELHVKEYQQSEKTVKIEVYRHATTLDAFGMYSQERYQDVDFMSIGAQAYGGDGYLNFLKDRYYVKLVAYHTPIESLKLMASKMAELLDGKNQFPSELDLLPEKGRKPASEKYIADNYLGLSFLNQVVAADYNGKGSDYSVFVVQGSPEQLRNILSRYSSFVKKPLKNIDEGVYEFKDPYNGSVILKWRGGTITGFINLKDKTAKKEYLRS